MSMKLFESKKVTLLCQTLWQYQYYQNYVTEISEPKLLLIIREPVSLINLQGIEDSFDIGRKEFFHA